MALKAKMMEADKRDYWRVTQPTELLTFVPMNRGKDPTTTQVNASKGVAKSNNRVTNRGPTQNPPQRENPHAKPMGDICYRCHKPRHCSNNCPERRQANLLEVDGKEKDEEEEEEEEEENAIVDDEYDGVEFSVKEGMEILNLVLHLILLSPKEEGQRYSIFHSLCSIKNKVCEVIVDNGSCANFVSKKLVNLLQLPIENHLGPYSLSWVKRGPFSSGC